MYYIKHVIPEATIT